MIELKDTPASRAFLDLVWAEMQRQRAASADNAPAEAPTTPVIAQKISPRL
jgi:hypothetical protein